MPYAPYNKLGSYREQRSKEFTPGETKQAEPKEITPKRNKARRRQVMTAIKRNQ